MNATTAFLLALGMALAFPAAAQTSGPAQAEPPVKQPSEQGPRGKMKVPSDPGAVVVPPKTGTEEIVKTPNKAVDPKIDDATEDIDRRNRKKSADKSRN